MAMPFYGLLNLPDNLPRPSIIIGLAETAEMISISSQGLLVTSKKVTISR
jgi:hypothetical protein